MGIASKIRTLIRESLETSKSDHVIVERYAYDNRFDCRIDFKEFSSGLIEIIFGESNVENLKASAALSFAYQGEKGVEWLLNTDWHNSYAKKWENESEKKVFQSIQSNRGRLIYGLVQSLDSKDSGAYEAAKLLLIAYSQNYPYEITRMITVSDKKVPRRAIARLAEEIVPFMPSFPEHLLGILEEAQHDGKVRVSTAKRILQENADITFPYLVSQGARAANVFAYHLGDDEHRFYEYAQNILIGIGSDALTPLQIAFSSGAISKPAQHRILAIYQKLPVLV